MAEDAEEEEEEEEEEDSAAWVGPWWVFPVRRWTRPINSSGLAWITLGDLRYTITGAWRLLLTGCLVELAELLFTMRADGLGPQSTPRSTLLKELLLLLQGIVVNLRIKLSALSHTIYIYIYLCVSVCVYIVVISFNVDVCIYIYGDVEKKKKKNSIY